MGCKKTLLLFVCWITYLCLGALAFIAIEKGYLATQQEARADFNKAVADFAREYSSCGVTRDSVLTFLENHGRHAQANGVFNFDVDPSKGVQDEWSMTNALVFTSEIVTTIGHGTLTPRTSKGRLACIVYALFGVPLCGFMLAAVGDAALILADKLDGVFRRRLRLALLVNAARLFVIVLVFWSIVVTLPTLIYTRTEGWNWVKAQYFSFTGMSTVGFGDVKVSLHRYKDSVILDWCYKGGTTVYCFLCLGIVSTVFKVIFRWHKNHIQQTRVRFRTWRRKNCTARRRSSNIAFLNTQ